MFRNRFKIPGNKTQAVNVGPASPGTGTGTNTNTNTDTDTNTNTDTDTNTKPANTLL